MTSNANLAAHCEIAIAAQIPGKFNVTVTTSQSLRTAVLPLISSVYTSEDAEGMSRIGVVINAQQYKDAIAQARYQFGTYFTLGMPVYWFDGGVLIADRIPGDHRFMSITTIVRDAGDYVPRISEAALSGKLPELVISHLPPAVELTLTKTPADYLGVYGKVARLFRG